MPSGYSALSHIIFDPQFHRLFNNLAIILPDYIGYKFRDCGSILSGYDKCFETEYFFDIFQRSSSD